MMIKYAYHYAIFHAARFLQAAPGLPFSLWMSLMQIKLNAAKQMARALETDWDKEVNSITR